MLECICLAKSKASGFAIDSEGVVGGLTQENINEWKSLKAGLTLTE